MGLQYVHAQVIIQILAYWHNDINKVMAISILKISTFNLNSLPLKLIDCVLRTSPRNVWCLYWRQAHHHQCDNTVHLGVVL